MNPTIVPLFLILNAACRLIQPLVQTRIVSSVTQSLFNEAVLSLENDCINGGIDIHEVNIQIDKIISSAEEPYNLLD